MTDVPATDPSPDGVAATIGRLVDQYRAGDLDRSAFADAVCALDWEHEAIAAIDALNRAWKKDRLIEFDLYEEISQRVSRMRRLTAEYGAGTLGRAAYIDAMLAFEWNPARFQTIPPEVKSRSLGERNLWFDAQIGKAVIPDSLDELRRIRTSGLVDDDTYFEIYRRRLAGRKDGET